jgi:2-iminobutanoate/2-iminopropanoate deaminase
MSQAIHDDAAPPPAGPYVQGRRVGDLLFVAGQGPFDRDGRRVGETFAEQVDATLDNLQVIARAGGSDLAHAVRIGVFLRDLGDFPVLNEVLERRLGDERPVRTTVPAALNGFDVEIDAIFEVPS